MDLNVLRDKVDSMFMYIGFHSRLQKRDEIFEEIIKIEKEISTLMDKLSKKKKDLAKKEKEIKKLRKRKRELSEKLASLNREIEVLKTKFNFLKEENGILKLKVESLSKDKKELEEFKKKYKLLVEILKAKNENSSLKELKDIILNKFLPLVNKIDVLPNEAEMLMIMQDVLNELEVISAYPSLSNRPILAVGGGFSAGKSEFISSFIEGFSLPRGIEPTTAIPTYIVDGEDGFIGINKNGGIVEFDAEDKKLLSHNFVNFFDFNLKEILPYMIISMPLKDEVKNLCLVDTPGYNPSGVHTKDDVNITKSLLRDANAIIWLIGLDSNGTVPKSDLDFLESVNLEGKELYVVLNKADIRPMDDLEDIIEEVAETLEDFDIEFEGISAYSSVRGKEFLFDRKSLFEFFEEASWFPATKHSEIKNKIAKIKNAYKEAILNKIEENKKLSNSLHSIGLDILESGVESDIYFKIEELKSIFYEENSKLKRFLKELENVFKEINWEIDDIFKNNK